MRNTFFFLFFLATECLVLDMSTQSFPAAYDLRRMALQDQPRRNSFFTLAASCSEISAFTR